MEKINIAELLKDCPTGMELDCLMYDNLYFKCIREHAIYPIVCYTIDSKGEKEEITFNWYGKYSPTDTAKCVIFPKGRTTWKGFDPYYQFKNGDVVATSSGAWIGITTGGNAHSLIPTYCVIKQNGKFEAYIDIKNKWCFSRLANKNEKQKLFQAIKENGYKWNAEKKELKKIEPKFYVGDWVVNKFGNIWHIDSVNSEYYQVSNGNKYCYFSIEEQDKMCLWTINDAKDGDVLVSVNDENRPFIYKGCLDPNHPYSPVAYCGIDADGYFCTGGGKFNHWWTDKKVQPATKEQRDLLFSKMKEMGYKWVAETKTLEKLLKFKMGDKVRHKNNHNVCFTITNIGEDSYICGAKTAFWFDDQDDYELVPNKFDINTLVPFESRILIRDHKEAKWRPAVWGYYDNEKRIPFPYVIVGGTAFTCCIPYEGNEYLLGKTDDCEDFYKTW